MDIGREDTTTTLLNQHTIRFFKMSKLKGDIASSQESSNNLDGKRTNFMSLLITLHCF